MQASPYPSLLEVFLKEIDKAAGKAAKDRGLRKHEEGSIAIPAAATGAGLVGGTLGFIRHALEHQRLSKAWQAGRAGIPREGLAVHDLINKPVFINPDLLRRVLIGTAAAIPAGLGMAAATGRL